MNLPESLAQFKCCMSNKPEHFVCKPKYLTCGHQVCSDCSTSGDGFNRIKCSHCGLHNTIELSKLPLVKNSRNNIEKYLNELSNELYAHLKRVHDDIESELTISMLSN
jgi:hypothetical protein